MNQWVSDSCACFCAHFLLPSCVVQLQSVDFALSYYVYFDVFYCSLGSLFFSNERERTGVDSEKKGGREKLGGAEEGDTLIGIYCIRKQSIFNKR